MNIMNIEAMMKKMNKILCTATIVLSATLISPLATARPSMANPGCFGDIGLEGYYYSYRENSLNNRFLISDKGPMYGLYFALGYQPESMALRFLLDGRYTIGNNISNKSRVIGAPNRSSYSISEFRLMGLYSWDLENEAKFEAYAGLGIRGLVDNALTLHSTTIGNFGYLRTSAYLYLPLGIRFVKDLDDLQCITHLEYDWFMSGTQRSYTPIGVFVNDQTRGFGARMGVDLLIPSSFACFDYRIGAFIRYWNIAASTVHLGFYAPRNQTYELGLRLGLAF